MNLKTCLAALSLPVMALAFQAQAQDAEAGKMIYNDKCAVCHSLIPGKRSVGPTLLGVFGKKAGTNDPNYSYSEAMTNSGKVWNEAGLNTYLTNPRADVPGIKMLFPGLPNATDRANLIAFLKTLH